MNISSIWGKKPLYSQGSGSKVFVVPKGFAKTRKEVFYVIVDKKETELINKLIEVVNRA